MKAYILFVCLMALNAGGASFRLPHQGSDGQGKAYSRVPSIHRQALVQAIDQMVDLQRRRQWGKIYDLLDETDKSGSKDGFVRKASRGPKLLNFSVRTVTPFRAICG